MNKQRLELLVGDNAFHGISHLSQQRARERSMKQSAIDIEYATRLVKLSLQNGANGFMFSVSPTTLSILKGLSLQRQPDLYAIVPYAYGYVRLATQTGGVSTLAKNVSRQIIFSRNVLSVFPDLIGIIKTDPSAFLKIYLKYEINRIKSAAEKKAVLKSVLLHEVITDMALGLNLDWVFKSYIRFLLKSKTRPGFVTRNFPFLVQRLKEWDINLTEITLTSSFNQIGFQMNPSKKACEKALEEVSDAQVIAMSIMAAGYLQPSQAIAYIKGLTGLSGVVAGVSREKQAEQTFNLLKGNLQPEENLPAS